MNWKYGRRLILIGFVVGYAYLLISLLWQPFAWSMLVWNPIGIALGWVICDMLKGQPLKL